MIEKIMEEHELRICDLETKLEMVLTKNKTIQEISKVIHGSEEDIHEELRRIKEENERTSKELKDHEIEIDNNALDIEVQGYLIEKIMKKMDNNTTNKEIVKEMIQEEFKKKYLQKRKDEIEKNSDGNKFGGYVNAKIDKFDDYINDSKSFLFSIESKGRIQGMNKFDIKQPQYAFYVGKQSDDYLFEFGVGDIRVYKENNKTKSSCIQYSFEYKGIEDALCGKQLPEHFTPQRIIVIEMK
ncbi:hypothetical protein EDI_064530 [Entamoeba dispar SAW760]|uniref:TLDc domain-containing protein n=1 Tax=Entamoeba dispar (strain ATCC PRA-260 / SAW760) TaxID=370354 RepID=B0E922_ENTDS|nr:uncharacterized protein EDI_064530 [Entamoeba dispar SAW760]EDR28973.1 hypothetical protein EDI_064530 [Entamoeba dispar SAW760]|eukprot:EDR28973.1 hypothetical protein EDI_064530 [Entamoeba dispar SAW760]